MIVIIMDSTRNFLEMEVRQLPGSIGNDYSPQQDFEGGRDFDVNQYARTNIQQQMDDLININNK